MEIIAWGDYLKKILSILLIFSILILASCSLNTEGRILNKLDKHLSKYTGYSTELEMKISMDDNVNIYKMRERNTLNNNYSLEILEPKDSSGITIEFDGDKVHLKHSTIKQSILLSPVKDFDGSLLIGKFFRNPQKLLNIKEEEVSNTKYYVFRNRIDNKNRYSKEQVIYLNKKNFVPHQLNILDSNGNVRVSIKYINFKFTKD